MVQSPSRLDVQVLSQVPGLVPAGTSECFPPVLALLGLAHSTLSTLLAHPLTRRLRAATAAFHRAGGAPASTTAMQPLNPDYRDAVQPYLAAAAAAAAAAAGGEGAQEHLELGRMWQLLARAVAQSTLQLHAAQVRGPRA